MNANYIMDDNVSFFIITFIYYYLLFLFLYHLFHVMIDRLTTGTRDSIIISSIYKMKSIYLMIKYRIFPSLFPLPSSLPKICGLIFGWRRQWILTGLAELALAKLAKLASKKRARSWQSCWLAGIAGSLVLWLSLALAKLAGELASQAGCCCDAAKMGNDLI